MLVLTEQAQKAVEKFLEKEEKSGYALRVSVVGGGCSGFQYDLSLAEKPTDDDEIYRFGKVAVFVDKTSLSFLKGTTIDYVSGLSGEGFVFENPNALSSCGCGHSCEA